MKNLTLLEKYVIIYIVERIYESTVEGAPASCVEEHEALTDVHGRTAARIYGGIVR